MRAPALMLLLAACTDYELAPKDDNNQAGQPDIVVSPSAYDLIVCGAGEGVVTVSNEGSAPLNVSNVRVEGEGWTLSGATSFTVQPGESERVPLNVAPGEATLRILSDDPDEPAVAVPLHAVADGPPTVSIAQPAEGAILDQSADFVLQGQLADDADDPASLAATWSSSVDGPLASDPTTPDGESLALWTPADHSPGAHTLTLSATDTCGNVASAQVGVCQQAGYIADELDIGTWHFEGSAQWDSVNNWVQLTSTGENQVGTAFQTGQTAPGDAVSIRFSFYIGGGSGADGLSLTALDTSRMSTFLGGTGCGIGYGGDAGCTAGPALPGWSIEIDTYYNGGYDPTDQDHVMFTFDGDVDDAAAWAVLPEMEDTGWHTMEVYVAAPHLTVVIDGVAYIDQDLGGFTSFPAYVGFTAGTGSLTNYHLIESLEVTEYVCGE